MLADYYLEVIATDASASQIENCITKNGVRYQVALAETTDIETKSVDLVTVAQAVHWFDLPAFTIEVNRVLKPGGVLAVWTYNLTKITTIVDQIVNDLYGSVLAGYWPEERKFIETEYADIRFPFQDQSSPKFQMAQQWNLSQLIGYLSTWSAVKRYQTENGVNPVEKIYSQLSKAWGQADKQRTVIWPLTVKIWKTI